MSLRGSIIVVVALLPSPATAHVAIPGIGSAYAAFAHATTEPPAALALLALGLLAGMHGAAGLMHLFPAFLLALLVGVATTLLFGVVVDPELPLLYVALGCGLYTAGGFPLPATAAIAIGAFAGAVFGIFSAPAPASWSTQAYFISGGLTGASFALIWLAAAVAMLRARWPMHWVSIGLRIVASWIAAIAALMAALAAR